MNFKEKKIVFAQGMRRSGTTILYDLFLESGIFECFYEPLALGKSSYGGGSQMHKDIDLFENVRLARKEFITNNPSLLNHYPDLITNDLFNYGAPQKPDLEFKSTIPPYINDYILYLISKSDQTFIKFTRMHSKVKCLHKIAPNAKFIHIVRDPRQVVASYLFGKNRMDQIKFQNKDIFFERISKMNRWSSRPFSDHILKLFGYENLNSIEDFFRILAIWKYKFETTHQLGRNCFGENYFLLNHEKFASQPIQQISMLFNFLEVPVTNHVLEWAKSNIKKPSKPYEIGDKRWDDAFSRLNLWEALEFLELRL